MAESKVYCMDCLQAMREMPDNAYDLAVVDPPYGNAGSAEKFRNHDGTRFGGRFDKYKRIERTGGSWSKPYGKKIIGWDSPPPPEYFTELFRVSKNQIIWGGNYFQLPPTRCFLIWRKLSISESFSMSMVEYAWTSYFKNAKIFDYPPQGGTEKRFHPTQKPIALYKWIFANYAEPGFKILDTHLGSGSSRIAAYDMGLDFTGYEIDEEYYNAQEERFRKHAAQLNMFIDLGVE